MVWKREQVTKLPLGEWKNTETREMDDCWALEGPEHILKVRLIGSFLQVFGCMGIGLVQNNHSQYLTMIDYDI